MRGLRAPRGARHRKGRQGRTRSRFPKISITRRSSRSRGKRARNSRASGRARSAGRPYPRRHALRRRHRRPLRPPRQRQTPANSSARTPLETLLEAPRRRSPPYRSARALRRLVLESEPSSFNLTGAKLPRKSWPIICSTVSPSLRTYGETLRRRRHRLRLARDPIAIATGVRDSRRSDGEKGAFSRIGPGAARAARRRHRRASRDCRSPSSPSRAFRKRNCSRSWERPNGRRAAPPSHRSRWSGGTPARCHFDERAHRARGCLPDAGWPDRKRRSSRRRSPYHRGSQNWALTASLSETAGNPDETPALRLRAPLRST